MAFVVGNICETLKSIYESVVRGNDLHKEGYTPLQIAAVVGFMFIAPIFLANKEAIFAAIPEKYLGVFRFTMIILIIFFLLWVIRVFILDKFYP